VRPAFAGRVKLWPVGALVTGLGTLCGLGCRQASAGWFGWLRNDTKKLEAANRAVHAAAEVVNESARLQADQNVAISEAITALSSERAQLAGPRVAHRLGRDRAGALSIATSSRRRIDELTTLDADIAKTLTSLIEKEDVEIPLIETLELIQEPDGSPTDDFVIPKGFQSRQKRRQQGR
jgi:hypothetical protein